MKVRFLNIWFNPSTDLNISELGRAEEIDANTGRPFVRRELREGVIDHQKTVREDVYYVYDNVIYYILKPAVCLRSSTGNI